MAVRVPYKERKRRQKIILSLLIVVALLAITAIMILGSRGEEPVGVGPKLKDLKSALDLLTIEYTEAVSDGRVVLGSEYEVSKNLTERAIRLYQEIRNELDSVSPELSERLWKTLQELRNAVYNRENPEIVDRLVKEAISSIDLILERLGST
ncbi:MAG: hypothetical protein F7C07_06280 [Desulfurococcales archaeon]|nr:hypothetical protein [Desulfurococcales archaeon]